jgi:hypothetical protein
MADSQPICANKSTQRHGACGVIHGGMSTLKDRNGCRYGMLVVIGRAPNAGRFANWICQCDCGNIRIISAGNLKRPSTYSCGCAKGGKVKHGMAGTRMYRIWSGMKARCYNPSNDAWGRYGGRGIVVCERWHDFAMFIADMGERPAGTSLDRINNDGNYEPGNCRWATQTQQTRNTRSNRWVVVDGLRMVFAEAAEKYGISPATAWLRLKSGWSEDDAFMVPAFGRRSQ